MDGQGVLRRAIFLDRDGTLNKDTGYVHRKEDWHWLPGVVEALKRFHAVGYALVVVSNQSGLARGMYDLAALHELEAWINADLEAKGAAIDAWYYCPHLPEITGPCSCRKPAPGLILRAAEEMGLDLARSWMVGDRVRDVEAGLAAGCRCVLLRPAQGGYEADAPVPPGVAVGAASGCGGSAYSGAGAAPFAYRARNPLRTFKGSRLMTQGRECCQKIFGLSNYPCVNFFCLKSYIGKTFPQEERV